LVRDAVLLRKYGMAGNSYCIIMLTTTSYPKRKTPAMRKIAENSINMFDNRLEELKIDIHNRDELPTLLLGLQELYRHPDQLSKILRIVETILPQNIRRDTGREGMNLWQILVLAMVRLSCNNDYDKLSDIAGNHFLLREFLHDCKKSDKRYPRQTLADNLKMFTPEVLAMINGEINKIGHTIMKSDGPKESRIDSFVVETDVHFPTDLSLIWDGSRSMIRLATDASEHFGISGWREHKSISRKIKYMSRSCQLIRKKSAKLEATKISKKCDEIKSVETYRDGVTDLILKVKFTLCLLRPNPLALPWIEKMEYFIMQTEKVLDQLIRRVVKDEKITHAEKIFSIFEPHTEWIVKGKAGITQELGVRVAIAEDECGFLMDWRVMFQETDDKVTIPMAEKILQMNPTVNMFSFDKGFYTPENKEKLHEMVDNAILPQKGKMTKTQKADTQEPEYIKFRRKHSRIESAIHALENHGLDRCFDHGKDGFERYVGMAVVARNILQIGRIIQARMIEDEKRNRKQLA